MPYDLRNTLTEISLLEMISCNDYWSFLQVMDQTLVKGLSVGEDVVPALDT